MLAVLAEAQSSVPSSILGGSQLLVTPDPEYLTPSSGLFRYLHSHEDLDLNLGPLLLQLCGPGPFP